VPTSATQPSYQNTESLQAGRSISWHGIHEDRFEHGITHSTSFHRTLDEAREAQGTGAGRTTAAEVEAAAGAFRRVAWHPEAARRDLEESDDPVFADLFQTFDLEAELATDVADVGEESPDHFGALVGPLERAAAGVTSWMSSVQQAR
jgi:hypothetical protein